VDFAGLDHQIDVSQRFDAGERLGDAPHFQDRVHRALGGLFLVVYPATALTNSIQIKKTPRRRRRGA